LSTCFSAHHFSPARSDFVSSPAFANLQAGLLLSMIFAMSTVELIFEKSRSLPGELQQEALDFVEFLLARKDEGKEARDWSRFSAEQLAGQYAAGDAIYDED
jgi:hypothetical protein